VQEAAQFYKIEPTDIIVVYDEIDLAPGRIRVKQGGGSGGHNGIRSVDAHIGPDYWRVRLGVGHPGHPDLVAPYVLRPFDAEERPMFRKLIEAVAEAFPLMVAGNANAFMTKVNVLAPAPKPPKPEEDEDASPA
jgi:PTH1 family peptidyl-tRNA hydrolase